MKGCASSGKTGISRGRVLPWIAEAKDIVIVKKQVIDLPTKNNLQEWSAEQEAESDSEDNSDEPLPKKQKHSPAEPPMQSPVATGAIDLTGETSPRAPTPENLKFWLRGNYEFPAQMAIRATWPSEIINS
jgi:hypothetical protein